MYSRELSGLVKGVDDGYCFTGLEFYWGAW